MKIALILQIAGLLYRRWLRDLLIDYINDPDNTWDDDLIAGLDSFLGFKNGTP